MVAARRKPWDSPSKTTSRQRHAVLASRSAKRSDWSAGTTGSSAPCRSSTWPGHPSAWWIGERSR